MSYAHLTIILLLVSAVVCGCSTPVDTPTPAQPASSKTEILPAPTPPVQIAKAPTPEPEPEPPALPEAPPIPTVPTPLAVPGFEQASHIGPASAAEWPKPVVFVLHGNFDRPEWECGMWSDAANFYGWLLCTRGVRSPGASKAQDRWTYASRPRAEEEMEAALKALEARYPERVSREQTVLAGFSLGAIYAPNIALAHPGRYPYLFLVEGGVKTLTRGRLRLLKEAGVRGIGLAMSMPGRRRQAKRVVAAIQKAGMKAVFVDMEGAGHNYSSNFPMLAQKALAELVAP